MPVIPNLLSNTTRGETKYKAKSTDSPLSLDDQLAHDRKKWILTLELQNTRKKALQQIINGYSININALEHEIGAERNESETLESQE